MIDHDPRSDANRSGAPPWGALFRCVGVEAALLEISRWLDPDAGVDLAVDVEPAEGVRDPFCSRISGSPAWVLSARRGGVPDRELADRAAVPLEAWRASRLSVERVTARVEARARDLEALQALSRAMSECRSPADLLAAVAAAVHDRVGVDALGWVATFGQGDPPFHLARPLGSQAMRTLREVGRRGIDDQGPGPGAIEVTRLESYDASRGPREELDPRDVLTLPIVRRGGTAANLVVVTPERPGERALRFLYGAANHLALHLDRVLTVAEAEQGRFRSILDSMRQAVVLTDTNLRVIHANLAGDHLLERLAVPRGACLERIASLVLEPARHRALDATPAPAAEARLESGERLAVTVSAVRDDAGRAEGLVVVLDDVTESRRMLDQLAQAEKLSSLGRMLSGVAHELNNPLTSVLGFSQMARSTPPGEKLDRRLQLVHDEARRCQKIVQNLLRFARRHEPECKPFSLNEVVESAVQLLGYQLRVDGVALGLELDAQLPTLHGDAHEIQQVIVNLVTNAHQALKERGRGGTIVLRSSFAGAGRVRLEVEDDGPGIPESIRSRVFDPFFTTKPAGQGTGLGLSLVYGTVTAHGGTIEAGERPGGGASFRIDLPCAMRARSTEPEPALADSSAGAPARILVVDDERALAEMIREALEHDGHAVVTACEADVVLDRLESGAFDLVVSDLKMPGLGAERLWQELRARRPGLERHLLLTTGDTVSREPESFAARVGADLVHKPFAPDEIRRRVRSSLDRRVD
ncbi:MAG TPA: ATP-binding protein [Candidatus Polarisedimenticolaceae bacterium]